MPVKIDPKLTKKQASRILHRMYKILREKEFHFSFNSRMKNHADMQFDDKVRAEKIRIRHTSKVPGGIIALALHELLHALYEEWLLKTHTQNEMENRLIRMEKEMLKALSDKQLGNFLKAIAGHF